MGKGCKPRKGHSIAKLGNAYDDIDWSKKEESSEEMSVQDFQEMYENRVEQFRNEYKILCEKYNLHHVSEDPFCGLEIEELT